MLEFEYLYKKNDCTWYETFPDPVLTFKFLDDANISNDERKLAITFYADLKYDLRGIKYMNQNEMKIK